jgi:hypothetical protein
MKRFVLVVFAWLTVVSPAFALSNVFSVTPRTLDQGRFEFAVKHSATNGGASFRVTITAKKDVVPPESEGHLCSADSKSIGPLTAKTQVALQKTNHIWTATFVASAELVQNPEACFVFMVHAKATEGGKTDLVARAANYYVFKLRDFIKSSGP